MSYPTKDSKLKTIYLQPAFLICVAVLAVAGGGMSFAIKSFGVYLEKVPLPLKKPLELMDEDKLAPYRVVAKMKIENRDVLESLGTNDYIQWVVEDTQVPENSPVRKYTLFVTYYDLPDRVPHVPEECYLGSGYQKLASDNVTLELKSSNYGDNTSNDIEVASDTRTIEGKYLVFGGSSSTRWWRASKLPVLYIFHVNGDYAKSREEARLVLNKNLFRKSSYFCKIEVVFNRCSTSPNKTEAVAAGQKLLGLVLPVLEREHLPDW